MESPVNRVALAFVMLISSAAFALAASFDVQHSDEGTETTGGAPVDDAARVVPAALLSRVGVVEVAEICFACGVLLVPVHLACGFSVHPWAWVER